MYLNQNYSEKIIKNSTWFSLIAVGATGNKSTVLTMAMHQHTPDLLLPSQFDPYDEEDLFAKNLKPSHLHKDFSSNSKPWEPDPHGHRNELVFSNSPVESDLGSADTESDRDDDYIAELTRQMSHYMLQEDHDQNSLPCTEKMEKVCYFLPSKIEYFPPFLELGKYNYYWNSWFIYCYGLLDMGFDWIATINAMATAGL